MGVFSSSYPRPTMQTASINMISTSHKDKGKEITNESTSFSPFEKIYNAIQATSHSPTNDHLLVASDCYHMPYWLENPSPYLDYLSHTFPMDESIMEVMSLDEMPWEDYHHRSSFLSPCHMVEDHFTSMVSSDIVLNPQSLILTRSVDSEGNLCNITKTMPLDISVKPGVLENIFIG